LPPVRPKNGSDSWRRRAAGSLLLLSASLLVTLGILEIALRLLYPAPIHFRYPQEAYDFDRELGQVLRPRQTAFTIDRAVRTNTLGLRDHELTPVPAPGTLRVLALGDSQTFGNGLDLEETWPKQLERALPVTPLRRWEVINAGVPGTDTWQHEILLTRLLDVTQARAVVLAVYVNDVVPRHDPLAVDTAERTNTWQKRLAYAVRRSAVVTWLFYRVYLPWRGHRTHQAGSVEDHVIVGARDPRVERGWEQVERSLTAMKARCDARGVALLVAVLPRRDQVAGTQPGRAYTERALAVAASHGIDALDLLPALAAAYRVHGPALFVPWDGHNSATANGVIVAALAPRVVDALARRDARSARPARP
jgi:lysophospholipase L1-like esterase